MPFWSIPKDDFTSTRIILLSNAIIFKNVPVKFEAKVESPSRNYTREKRHCRQHLARGTMKNSSVQCIENTRNINGSAHPRKFYAAREREQTINSLVLFSRDARMCAHSYTSSQFADAWGRTQKEKSATKTYE